MPPLSAADLAATLGANVDQLRAVVQRALQRLPHTHYYVFRIPGKPGVERPPNPRPRAIAAFPTPDDALQWAQRNGHGSNAQVRRIAASELIAIMLGDSMIEAIMFQAEQPSAPARGFGSGVKIERHDLIEQIRADEQPAPVRLSAAAYDALQFGVDFTDRAEFRVALAQAVEDVVASYVPPEGSLDRGARSIFATSAVEAWLKTNGFPHAHQRRWIDVAGDPMWGGADELCEIDAGTRKHLLVQLLIHHDQDGRQYIKRVYVTS